MNSGGELFSLGPKLQKSYSLRKTNKDIYQYLVAKCQQGTQFPE